MKFTNTIYILLNIFLIITAQIIPLDIFKSMKREVRFTKFDIQSMNSTIFSVINAGIKQIREKHVLYGHFILHRDIGVASGMFEVLKCKDYYVDCVNVVSYDIFKICSKELDSTFFFSNSKNKNMPTSCKPGEHVYENMTLPADQFGAIFGLPTEKWWEKYWKINSNLYIQNKTLLVAAKLQFYFIQYRNRNRSPEIV